MIVDVWSGTTTAGPPLRSMFVSLLGGTTWTVDASPGMANGTYTARVTQGDSAGNSGQSTTHSFTIDTVQPVVTVTAPADGSTTADATPTISGTGGSAPGDEPAVHVQIYAGTGTGGDPVQAPDATISGGTWSVDAAFLANGVYTVVAFQDDDAGNGGFSGENTFTVAAP